MTIGTAIVISISILCVTFITVCGIGAWLQVKKSKSANQLTQALTDSISSKLKESYKPKK